MPENFVYSIAYPEYREVKEAEARRWVEDAITNGQIPGPATLTTHELLMQLGQEGSITYWGVFRKVDTL